MFRVKPGHVAVLLLLGVLGSLVGVVLAGTGYPGQVGPGAVVGSVPMGYWYADVMMFPTPGAYMSSDTLKIRRSGAYVPIRRVECEFLQMDGGGTVDSLDLEFGWASGGGSTTTIRVRCNDGTSRLGIPILLGAEWVRVKPYNTNDWQLTAYGTKR